MGETIKKSLFLIILIALISTMSIHAGVIIEPCGKMVSLTVESFGPETVIVSNHDRSVIKKFSKREFSRKWGKVEAGKSIKLCERELSRGKRK